MPAESRGCPVVAGAGDDLHELEAIDPVVVPAAGQTRRGGHCFQRVVAGRVVEARPGPLPRR